MTLRLPMLGLDPQAPFPDPRTALRRPDGLLAAGGDLTPARLLNAYRHGIFPWYSEGQPILWWSPDPRVVFRCDGVHLSQRFRRELRGRDWVVRADTAFDALMRACAETPRAGQTGTWITPAMHEAYGALHGLGYAHSIEVWSEAGLVGGLYGVAIGQMFFAESMFSAITGGSKAALAALGAILGEWAWPLFDAQVASAHLLRMGAIALPRTRFLQIVGEQVALPPRTGAWTLAVGERDMAWLLATPAR